MSEWEDVVVSTNSVLDCAVEPLGFRDMICSSNNVELYMEVSDIITHRFKLIVGQHDRYFESTHSISTDDLFEVF
eukprot:1273980-Prorocentrum_lima.AAC.1